MDGRGRGGLLDLFGTETVQPLVSPGGSNASDSEWPRAGGQVTAQA